MKDTKNLAALRTAVLARVPNLEELAASAPPDTNLQTYLAMDLVNILYRYQEHERRARAALDTAGRQVTEQQGYLDEGYSPLDTWLLQAANTYSTEAAAMKAVAERAMELAYVLQKLLAEQGTRLKPVPAFPREEGSR